MFSATVSVGASVSSWLIATMPCSIAWRGVEKRDRLAVDLDRAGVGLQRAVEDLHERRLARAVLAGERVDLARPQLEVDAVERDARRGTPSGSPSIRDERAVTSDASGELDAPRARGASRSRRSRATAARARSASPASIAATISVCSADESPAADTSQREVRALHQPVHVQPPVQLGDDRVPRQVDDQLVEGLVRAQVGELVEQLAVADRRDRRARARSRSAASVVRRPTRPIACSTAIQLERRARVVRLAHQARGERPHARSPAPRVVVTSPSLTRRVSAWWTGLRETPSSSASACRPELLARARTGARAGARAPTGRPAR